ncbi:hypothetical protein [Luteimicrobium album]|uniref:hypothetical protein n=1 Tax=Luteimicrobium album TaxID=1054550 RepID=UPI0024E0C321|nr:hypothetical protein [Luteimicrobium album]
MRTAICVALLGELLERISASGSPEYAMSRYTMNDAPSRMKTEATSLRTMYESIGEGFPS